MRHRSTFVKWSAILALALLAFAAAPHLHDETESNAESCVLCHVHDTPSVAASVTQQVPEPIGIFTECPDGGEHARDVALEGHGSRAPPA